MERLRWRQAHRLLPLSFTMMLFFDMFWLFRSVWSAGGRSVSRVMRYDVRPPSARLRQLFPWVFPNVPFKWAGFMFTTDSGSQYNPAFPKLCFCLVPKSPESAARLVIWARRSQCCCSCCCGWCCGVGGWAWPWAGNARPDSRIEPECPRTPDCWPVGRRPSRCCRGRPSPKGPRRTGGQKANGRINEE